LKAEITNIKDSQEESSRKITIVESDYKKEKALFS